MIKIYNITTKELLDENILVSDNYFKRLKGLMFKKNFKGGMIFKNLKYGSNIHTHFMRFAIDVYFIDENDSVYEIASLEPWKSYKPSKKAKYILEYKKSSKKRFKVNDKILIKKEN